MLTGMKAKIASKNLLSSDASWLEAPHLMILRTRPNFLMSFSNDRDSWVG